MAKLNSKAGDTLRALARWYEAEQAQGGRKNRDFIIWTGLAVLEKARAKFPLRNDDVVSKGNRLRTTAASIRKILTRFGEERRPPSEAARTTGGAGVSAIRLISALDQVPGFSGASSDERARVIDSMQNWLADKAREFFDKQRIEVELSIENPASQMVAQILAAAEKRKVTGAVAQYLVGAKLSVRHPDIQIENHSYTTADAQLQRPGDFQVEDTVFHVTVSPGEALIDKCKRNLANGFRVILLVPSARLPSAEVRATEARIESRIEISSIEKFVGQNLDEIGKFSRAKIAAGLKNILEKYNERVAEVEVGNSLLIEIPTNL